MEHATAPNYYSRFEHGSLPVWVEKQGDSVSYKVKYPSGEQNHFSARDLLRGLYGGHDPCMSFARYFRTGRFSRQKFQEPKNSILDLFCETPGGKTLLTSGGLLEVSLLSPLKSDPAVKALKKTPVKKTPVKKTPVKKTPCIGAVVGDPQLGIDLVNRSHEVAKLFYAGFARRVYRSGYDPEDVLQDVYRGLLARNKGTCPWDIKKSSFGHYVHMVIGCILANYHRREIRRTSHEQVGIYDITDDGEHTTQDVASSQIHSDDRDCFMPTFDAKADVKSLESYIAENSRGDTKTYVRLLPMLRDGYTRKEMAQALAVPVNVIQRAIRAIRRLAQAWALEYGYAVAF